MCSYFETLKEHSVFHISNYNFFVNSKNIVYIFEKVTIKIYILHHMRMCRLYLGGPGVGWTFFRIYFKGVGFCMIRNLNHFFCRYVTIQ